MNSSMGIVGCDGQSFLRLCEEYAGGSQSSTIFPSILTENSQYQLEIPGFWEGVRYTKNVELYMHVLSQEGIYGISI